MPERRKRTGQMASVDIVENNPSRSPDVLVAQEESRMVQSENQDTDGVTTTHIRPGTLVMYKPTENHGYVPRTVTASAVRMLLKQGWDYTSS